MSAGETALRQIDRIEQAIKSLDEMPERHRTYSEQPWLGKKLRIMRVDNYIVFYSVNIETVTVIRVMYGKRDIDARLSQEAETLEK